MIELRQLHHFIVVAEELHFRRAAQRLHITQPPLSHSIKRLEEDVGVDLFSRTNKTVRLTEAGEAFLLGARQTLRALESAKKEASRASQGLRGHLNVAFVGSATYDVLPRMLRPFRENHPDVELELLEMTSLEQMEALTRKNIDVGFLRPPVPGRDNINEQVVYRERMIMVLAENHPHAHDDRLRLADLSDDEFITFPNRTSPNLYSKLLMACHEEGFTPRIGQTASQIQTQVSLVAAGLGVAMVPACAQRLKHHGVCYRDIAGESEHLATSLSVAWRADELSSLMRVFIESCMGNATAGA